MTHNDRDYSTGLDLTLASMVLGTTGLRGAETNAIFVVKFLLRWPRKPLISQSQRDSERAHCLGSAPENYSLPHVLLAGHAALASEHAKDRYI